MGSVLSCCTGCALGCRTTSVGVIRNCVLGFGRCHLCSASLLQSYSRSPREGLVCSLFLHRVQMPQGWMVAHPHSLSPTSGISSCNIWPMLMWWPARFPSYLVGFSLSHYSVADRDWPLSLWNCLFGLQLGDLFRVSTLEPSLLLLSNIHLFLLLFLSASFKKSAFVSTLMIPRKSIISYHCVPLKVNCESRYTTVFTETEQIIS